MTSETYTPTKKMFGEEMIWLFILGDMCIFTLFFFLYLHFRAEDLALFQASQSHLSVHYGSINTLFLLASSWFVVVAINHARDGRTREVSLPLVLAILLGSLFAVLKVVEYQQKMDLGLTFETDNFFLFYYLLTGIHLAHLVSGLCILMYFLYLYTFNKTNERTFENLACGAIFWHMVDLLWIIIFPLLYLIP